MDAFTHIRSSCTKEAAIDQTPIDVTSAANKGPEEIPQTASRKLLPPILQDPTNIGLPFITRSEPCSESINIGMPLSVGYGDARTLVVELPSDRSGTESSTQRVPNM